MFHETFALPAPRVRTLADVRATLRQLPSAPTDLPLMLSAVNAVARVMGCAPDDIAADPADLRRALDKISAAMAGMTRSSWITTRSRLLKALRIADVPVMPSRRVAPLSPEWAALYQYLPQDSSRAPLARLIGYCSDHGHAPDAMCDTLIERFEHALTMTSMRGQPTKIVRAAIRAWNHNVEMVPGWPQQKLTLSPIQRQGYVLPATELSPEFQQSLKDYLGFLANPPEDDDDAPIRGLHPSTLKMRDFQLRQMASALIHSGVPVSDLQSVGDLAARENVNLICNFFTRHHGRADTEQVKGFLAILRPIAKQLLKDAALGRSLGLRLKRLCRGRTRRIGLTDKNRRRLSVFRDPKVVREMVLLPYKLLKKAETGKLRPNHAALLVRAAVAIEIELMCPIRLKNLAELNLGTDFLRSRVASDAAVHLFIPGSRTKNEDDIELEVPRQSWQLIEVYVQKYRNLLIQPTDRGRSDRFLFPTSEGMPQQGKTLGEAVCTVIERELGIQFNMHLFRHLGCFLFLQNNPGQFDVMRRVLGHRHVETTMRFYAEVQQLEAFRVFDQTILQLRADALRPTARRSR